MRKVLVSIAVVIGGMWLVGCNHLPSENETMTTEVNQHYRDYTVEEFEALKGSQKVVLFFYAQWCPTCRKWEKEIRAEKFPESAVILKVNYDKEKELKKRYGIKTQSIAVFLGADGETEKVLMDPEMDVVQSFFTVLDD